MALTGSLRAVRTLRTTTVAKFKKVYNDTLDCTQQYSTPDK